MIFHYLDKAADARVIQLPFFCYYYYKTEQNRAAVFGRSRVFIKLSFNSIAIANMEKPSYESLLADFDKQGEV